MVRVNKTNNIPAVLLTNGAAATQKNKAKYDLNPAAYHSKYHKTKNPFKFEFDNKIYGHITVKEQLKHEQPAILGLE